MANDPIMMRLLNVLMTTTMMRMIIIMKMMMMMVLISLSMLFQRNAVKVRKIFLFDLCTTHERFTLE